MAAASLWLPAYAGGIGRSDRWRLIAACLLIAAIAGIAVRARVESTRAAALSSLPALGALAAAATAGTVLGLTAEDPGAPLFLYFGLAMLVSWAMLVVSSTLIWGTRWNRLGLALTFVVAAVGYFLTAVQVN